MLLIAPVATGDAPRSRRSEHRSAAADLTATARTGQLANAAQPLPTPNFEDSRAGVWLFRLITVATLATAAHQLGWLA
jgi:hypothetical protein